MNAILDFARFLSSWCFVGNLGFILGGFAVVFVFGVFLRVWGFCTGGGCPGGFCPGGFCSEVFFPRGSFVRGVLSGGYCSGGFVSGGFCLGGFVQMGFVHGGGGLSIGGFCLRGGEGVCPPRGFVHGGILPCADKALYLMFRKVLRRAILVASLISLHTLVIYRV